MAKRSKPSVEVMEAEDGRWTVVITYTTEVEAWEFANARRAEFDGLPRDNVRAIIGGKSPETDGKT